MKEKSERKNSDVQMVRDCIVRSRQYDQSLQQLRDKSAQKVDLLLFVDEGREHVPRLAFDLYFDGICAAKTPKTYINYKDSFHHIISGMFHKADCILKSASDTYESVSQVSELINHCKNKIWTSSICKSFDSYVMNVWADGTDLSFRKTFSLNKGYSVPEVKTILRTEMNKIIYVTDPRSKYRIMLPKEENNEQKCTLYPKH